MDNTTVIMVETTQKYLQRKLEMANQRVETAQAHLATTIKDRDALLHVLTMHVETDARMAKREREGDAAELIRSLATKSPREGILLIAERNGGEVTSAEAVQLLVDAGVLTDKRETARSRVWEVLQDKRQFAKIERGRYRLLPKSEQTAGSAVQRFVDQVDQVVQGGAADSHQAADQIAEPIR